jgi:hypothetical protein
MSPDCGDIYRNRADPVLGKIYLQGRNSAISLGNSGYLRTAQQQGSTFLSVKNSNFLTDNTGQTGILQYRAMEICFLNEIMHMVNKNSDVAFPFLHMFI